MDEASTHVASTHVASNSLVFNMQKSITALMYATQCGHKDIVKALVERKANPNITADKVGLC